MISNDKAKTNKEEVADNHSLFNGNYNNRKQYI